jgi:hypothetical protein
VATRQNRFERLRSALTAIRSPRLGRTMREPRIIRAFLPSATKVEVLRRSDGAVLAHRWVGAVRHRHRGGPELHPVARGGRQPFGCGARLSLRDGVPRGR